MAKIEIKSDKITPFGGVFFNYGAIKQACVGDKIVNIGGDDGYVGFNQASTHERYLSRLETKGIRISRFCADPGSNSSQSRQFTQNDGSIH